MELFGIEKRSEPLAWRMRPTDLTEIVGQEHLLSRGNSLRNIIDADKLVSVVFYGPPGTGKTALAHIIANKTKANFIEINAVTSGIKEIRDAITVARSGKTVVFIDEIHRFNRIQQDALLPHIENGEIILIGASTENPFFALVPSLSSRTVIFKFHPLSDDDIKKIILMTISDNRGLGNKGISIDEDAVQYIVKKANGDARKALNILELAYLMYKGDKEIRLNEEHLKNTIHDKTLYYDENEHYDTISAFIKSMRGSDTDATVYWLAKMIESGEDPLFIARRIIICASEDVGNADPYALDIAVAAFMAVERIGMPEGRIPLSQAAIYVASAPKSNACYNAIESAINTIRNETLQSIPDYLKDSHYSGAERLGIKGYKYPHNLPGHYIKQNYTKNKKIFYRPSSEGFEKEIKKRLQDRRLSKNE